MFDHPIVSVIMPCFNQGRFIEEAVESVLNQTYPSYEIIIINDGSTDIETVRLLQDYDKPTVSILHTENRGPSAARNIGIQHAKGHYIFPLDADDRIAETYLEKAVATLDGNPNVGIVYSQATLFGEKSGDFDVPSYRFPEILLGNMIFNSSLYRKTDWEKVGGYNENMIWGWEDYDFWLSLLELGREVIQIPEKLYFHREVPNSRSQKMTQDYWIKCHTQIFRNHPNLYADHMDVVFRHLVELRQDVTETHARLHSVISTVKQSPFWKLRNRWVKLKQRFGVLANEDPLLFP